MIKSSENENKKIDVHDNNNEFLNSIRDMKYNDYDSYIKLYGLIYADRRRCLCISRHKKRNHQINSKQYFAAKILW